MAVLKDRHSSGQGKFSDKNAEEADCSPSLHKKEMLARENDYDDDDTESEGPPDHSSSSGDDEQDNQDSQDFIIFRESAELFESDDPMVTRNQGSVSPISVKVNCWSD